MAEYKIISEDTTLVTVKCGYLTYTIDKKLNALIRVSSSTSEWVNAVIPNILPSGHRIDYLCSGCTGRLPGNFKKLVISNGIEVCSEAFWNANIKELVWPEDCLVIPDKCFRSSALTKITNIQNVQAIEEHAFEGCSLQTITWPSSCDEIPAFCFQASANLSRIDNISHIRKIGEGAFRYAGITHLDLSCTNISCLSRGSLFGLSKYYSVPPYYVSEEEWNEAFSIIYR